jgi:4-hydroxybenzoate polyprenyltransferase
MERAIENVNPREAAKNWLRLLRVPNLFTIPGDIFVGFFFVLGACRAGFPACQSTGYLLLLVGASLCLYAAGLILNDFFDLKTDRAERPDRPIASGAISRKLALLVALSLLALALVLAALVGVYTLAVCAVLAALLIFYDAAASRVPVLRAVTMGLCRGLNVMLGASVAFPALGVEPGFAALVIMLYVVAVSALSLEETRAAPRLLPRFAPLIVLASGLAAFILYAGFSWPGLAGACIAVVGVLSAIFVIRRNYPGGIGALLRCLILIQAALLLIGAAEFLLAAGIIYAFYPACLILGRWFYGS